MVDQFIERTHRNLSLQSAKRRDITSLQHWVDGTGCLAQDETAYLSHHSELISLDPQADTAVLNLENWVEDKLIQYWHHFRRVGANRYLIT